MSGLCDTCKRNQVCRKPMDGMDSCRLYVSGKESNYERLFGTPERAARTMIDTLVTCEGPQCTNGRCPFRQLQHCPDYDDYAALLEWLRGDA